MTWENDNEWEERFLQMEAKGEKHMEINKIVNEGLELDDPLAIRQLVNLISDTYVGNA